MIRILNGDCLTELPKLAAAGERFHAAVTDPPYHLTSQAVRELGHPSFNSNTKRERAVKKAGFMGEEWDGGDIAFRPETWRAVYDCLLPGAYLLAFGSTRGSHRMTCAIEDAGFEIRDTISHLHDGGLDGPLLWMFGSGFPKSHDVSKAIDATILHGGSHSRQMKQANESRPGEGRLRASTTNNGIMGSGTGPKITRDEPATPEAARWAGWGSALKPAYEPIIVARKPLEGTIAANVLKHSCGGLNIDATRIPISPDGARSNRADSTSYTSFSREACPKCRIGRSGSGALSSGQLSSHEGPHPNAFFDAQHLPQSVNSQGDYHPSHHSDGGRAHVETMGDQSPVQPQRGVHMPHRHCDICGRIREHSSNSYADYTTPDIQTQGRWPANVIIDDSQQVADAFAAFGERESRAYPSDAKGEGAIFKSSRSQGAIYPGDTGTAARFFYCAKADATDRAGSKHPTVKPSSLMRWLITLVCPPGGTVLDPFAGSGSTLLAADQLGFNAVGIEMNPTYAEDARRKVTRDAGLFAEVETNAVQEALL